MRLDLIRRSEPDIDPSAISSPARHTGGKMRIRVGDTPVMLFLVLVLNRLRRGVPPKPELLHELFPLLIRAQLLKGPALIVRNDPRHVLADPFRVRGLQFFPGPLCRRNTSQQSQPRRKRHEPSGRHTPHGGTPMPVRRQRYLAAASK